MLFGCLLILSMRSTSFVVTYPCATSQRTRGSFPIFFTTSLLLSQACSLPNRANLTLFLYARGRLKVNPECPFYSQFQRQWSSVINADVDKYLAEAEAPSANSPSVKDHSRCASFRQSDKKKLADLSMHLFFPVWCAG
jgi:hypothetical protein